jgi:hypothetical protein
MGKDRMLRATDTLPRPAAPSALVPTSGAWPRGRLGVALLLAGLVAGCADNDRAPTAASLAGLAVAITSPPDGTTTRTPLVAITGTVSDPAIRTATLFANGVPKEIVVLDGAFREEGVLVPGLNTIIVAASDAAGRAESAPVRITLETSPPALAILDPTDGATTTAVAVRVDGTVGASAVRLTVNGAPVPIVAGTWQVAALPLALGANAIEVVAVDTFGETASAVVHVNRVVPAKPPTVSITSPLDGTLTRVPDVRVAGTVDDPGASAGTLLVNGAPVAFAVAGGAFAVTVRLSEGPSTLVASVANAAGTGTSAPVQVTVDTTPPRLAISAPADRSVVFAASVTVSGTVDDPAATVAVNGLPTTVAGGAWTLPALPLALGDDPITAVATDLAGNSASVTIHVTGAVPALQSIALAPRGARLHTPGAQALLAVSGLFTDGTTHDLTPAAAGTTYGTSNRFVATVSPDGLVTALANGSADITVQNLAFQAVSTITVEIGVTLTALAIGPPAFALRGAGAARQLAVTGTFSDGTVRDLTAAVNGTTYAIAPAGLAIVSPDGLVTALAPGAATITAADEGLSVAARVALVPLGGTGFVRGQVLDDTKGLLLDGALAALLSDGGGALAAPPTATSDERGRFLLSGIDGPALVRVSAPGFTAVERTGAIPPDAAATVLDARLTPLDPRANTLTAALGGVATSAGGAIALDVPPGGIADDAELRLTALSPQGLEGALPPGWSPVAAAAISPAGLAFAQPAVLRLPNTSGLAAGTTATAVFYDEDAHAWRALAPAAVSADGTTLACAVTLAAEVAVLLADDPPADAPPAPAAGDFLAGVAPAALPDAVSATSSVLPRAAPAGPGVRAVAEVVLEPAAPLPSGTVVKGVVSEHFDLASGASVVPEPFAEDIVLYARPRAGGPLSLGATFPVTPSRSFTILELLLGAVHVRIEAPGAATGGVAVGPAGATVTASSGEALVLAPGALAAPTAADLLELSPADLPLDVSAGGTLRGAVRVDLGGASLGVAGGLSVPRPLGMSDTAQVIVALVFADPLGVERLKLVAVGDVSSTGIAARTQVGGLALPGVREGGVYVFLEMPGPVGFVAGTVVASGGAAPQAGALVLASTAPLADLTGADGAYVVAAAAGASTTVSAIVLASGDSASATAAPALREDVVLLDLTLASVAPVVVTTTPAPGASGVALDAPISVGFSRPLDPGTISPQTVALRGPAGDVPGRRTLSPDGAALAFVPDAALASATTYTLFLTAAVADPAGDPLAPLALTFTTLDTSKPPAPPAGVIAASLPDRDGLVLITGTQGTAEPRSGVTATNLRTQETITVLALDDGSFRLRLAAQVGDPIGLTFRNAGGQDQTIAIDALVGEDGSVGLSAAKGGSAPGAGGRTASVLPRALAGPAVLKVADAGGAVLASLPPGMTYVDSFDFTLSGGPLARLASLALTESQGRFAPAQAFAEPFVTATALVVPPDFLVNGTLKFHATADDAAGDETALDATTLVVAASPAGGLVEAAQAARFPTVFLHAPAQALPNQLVPVDAIAPAARVDFDLPDPIGPSAGDSLVLVSATALAGAPALAVVDEVERVDEGGAPHLVTAGRAAPGVRASGTYAVVASSTPLVFLTGRIAGPPAVVSVAGTPFVFAASGPNAAFRVPVAAGAPYTLVFSDPQTGAAQGLASGVAPLAGEADLGVPLAPAAPVLSVRATPDASSLVDIGASVVLTFSEPLDATTVGGGTIFVTDLAGNRVFGRLALSADGAQVTFAPLRRWHYGRTYRYAVAGGVLAQSGARLAAPFDGTFTTFAPALIANADIGSTGDVAVSGSVLLAGGDGGLTVLDVTAPEKPAAISATALAGGVGGVAFLAGAGLADRTGALLPAALALVASGDPTTVGRVTVFDLTTPAAPAALGAAQVSAAQGAPGPIEVDADGAAAVACRAVGVVAVAAPLAVPDDPAHPSAAVVAEFPAAGLEGADDVAPLGGNLLVAGAAGLRVLDGATLTAIGLAATGGEARGVAALAAFAMDRNGDGAIDPTTEVFDLAVVAGGADGTVQLWNLADPTSPALVSIVRVGATTTSVVIDAEENLAYVGAGAAGVAIVDLAGPASVQPIDQDRDGVDDRILGFVATPGAAGRIALDHGRGVGYVAEAARGVAVILLLPPRARFVDVLRDPVAAASGDEESIRDSHTAFIGDDAIRLVIDAAERPRTSLFLTIDETPDQGGPKLLHFADGSISAAIASGVSSPAASILKQPAARQSHATFKIRDQGGEVLDRFDVLLSAAGPAGATLVALYLTPSSVTIAASQQTAPLAVEGLYSNGEILNLSTAASGTTYAVSNPAVAAVSPDGVATALAGGATRVTASNGGLAGVGVVLVQSAPTLTALVIPQPLMTLMARGAQQALLVAGRFSDDTLRDVTSGFGAVYASSAPGVATVDANGLVTAVGIGKAFVDVSIGAQSARATVAVEPRIPPTVTGISLAPFAAPAFAGGSLDAQASVVGTGSLEGLIVTFALGGARTPGLTDYGGLAFATLANVTVTGSVTVTASVLDPASGRLWSDAKTVVILPGAGDNEPNDTLATASRLAAGEPVQGTVDGTLDPVDLFAFDTPVGGTLTVTLALPVATNPAAISVVVRDAGGALLAQFSPVTGTSEFLLPIADGRSFVEVDDAGAATAYTLSVSLEPADIQILSVTPPGGGPGAAVAIAGTGFSEDAGDTFVSFGGIAAKVVTATPTLIVAIVPANAVDGRLRVISGAKDAFVAFAVGQPGPGPVAFLTPPADAAARFDPVSGSTIAVNRVRVALDPGADRSAADAIAAAFGGAVVGFLPGINLYFMEFPDVTTIHGLEALRRRIEADPRVVFTDTTTAITPASSTIQFDTRSFSPAGFGFAPSIAYEQVHVLDAIEAIRASDAFRDPASLRPVRVAVIDSGFKPSPELLTQEFTLSSGANIVQFFSAATPLFASTGLLAEGSFADDKRSPIFFHGTFTTSVIAGLNNGLGGFGGVLMSLLKGSETDGKASDFPILVYALSPGVVGQLYWEDGLLVAIEDIALRDELPDPTQAVDVVNISYGELKSAGDISRRRRLYRGLFARLRPRTLLTISAGNGGANAAYQWPAALALDLDNVMSVGAANVTSPNLDGLVPDRPSVFSLPGLAKEFAVPDDLTLRHQVSFPGLDATNTGDSVTIAAPGDSILSITGGDGDKIQPKGGGTSGAAPMVAGVAAILQAIRPNAPPLSPQFLRDKLVSAGDDITALWTPYDQFRTKPMHRLNALTAALSLLPATTREPVYIVDQEGTDRRVATGALVTLPPGAVIASERDPFSGAGRGNDRIIPLQVDLPYALRLTATLPSAIAISPRGDEAYVVVKPSPSAGVRNPGDGVLVINTHSGSPVNFIPFSGNSGVFPTGLFAVPPGTPTNLPPVSASAFKPGMAFSRDGRLLYVATGPGIVVINTVDAKVVRSFGDLPAPFNVNAASQPPNGFGERLQQIAGLVDPSGRVSVNVGAFTLNPKAITTLAVSPDGKTLYAVLSTGEGGGRQPGLVVPIDIDLYRDADAKRAGLAPILDDYLLMRQGSARFLHMFSPLDPTGAGAGDTPSAIAFQPDNPVGAIPRNHAYLLNGGEESYAGQNVDFSSTAFGGIFGADAVGPSMPGQGGVEGVLIGATSIDNQRSQVFQQFSDATIQALQGGFTLVSAPGYTGVFDTTLADPNDTKGGLQWEFPSSLTFGWNPRPNPINQLNLGDVFVSRPFALAMRPDGGRALIGFFQTGNFGVLDLNSQNAFLRSPPTVPQPNTAFRALPQDLFWGVVAATEAIPLDQSVWPRRGRAASLGSLPSIDEARLYVSDIAYAQSRAFAVATHRGVNAPRVVAAIVPDVEFDGEARLAFQDLGFKIDPGNPKNILRPDGSLYAKAGDTLALDREGGAVSFIRDDEVSVLLAQNLNAESSDAQGRARAFFSAETVLDQPAMHEAQVPVGSGTTPQVDTLLYYGAPIVLQGTAPIANAALIGPRTAPYSLTLPGRRFVRPHAVAIQPYVAFESPRFGDMAGKGTAIQVRWREPGMTSFIITIRDLDVRDGDGSGHAIGGTDIGEAGLGESLSVGEVALQTFKRELGRYLLDPNGLIPGHHLRILVGIRDSQGDSLGVETTMVQVETPMAPPTISPVVTELRKELSPSNPVIVKGKTQQFTMTSFKSDGTTEDETSDFDWATLDPGIVAIDPFGLAAGVSVGQTQVQALSLGAVRFQTTATVKEVVSVDIAPVAPTIRKGKTQSFSAIGTLNDGTQIDISNDVAWSSSSPAVATIDAFGLASALSGGTTTIQATPFAYLGAVPPATTTLTVKTLTQITVIPADATIRLGHVAQYTAVGTFDVGSQEFLDPSEIVWSTDDPTIVVFDVPPQARALKVGATTARAHAVDQTPPVPDGTTSVNVVKLDKIDVTPPSGTVKVNATFSFQATGTLSDQFGGLSTADLSSEVTWATSNPAAATIDATGLATGVAEGTTTISASEDGVSSGDPGGSSATLLVKRLVSLDVAPTAASIRKGETKRFTATGTFSDQSTEDLSGTVVWSSDRPAVADIDPSGLAIAFALGQATIRAASDQITSNDATLTVATLVAIDVNPAASFAVGATLQCQALGHLSDQTTEDITAGVAWSSPDPSVVAVDAGGLATGAGAGAGEVDAAADGITGRASLSVVPVPPAGTGPSGSLVVINEIDDEPQLNWNDPVTPFDATPGAAPPSVADQWIELTNLGSTVDLTGWTLTIAPPAAPSTTIPLGSLHILGTGELAVLGAPGAPGGFPVTAVLTLKDPLGIARDTVDLAALHAALGSATGPGDETMARIPNGFDTGHVGDFRRGAATIGSANH